jgi:beta-lactamase regulating signal transducer with metallopeptidase domain
MNISNFFNTYAGMYVAQAFCHSLIAALIVDRAIQAWGITNPLVRQRFSLIVMILPLVSYPLYQLINPNRGSVSFRLETLFDINRWLNLELWGIIPVNLLFIIMLVVTTLVFLVQEMIPIVVHTLESRRSSSGEEEEAVDNPAINDALESFPGEKPRISVIDDDDDFLLFSTTGKNPTVFLSSGLVEGLDREQLQAAIAHEVAHIERNRRPLLMVVYVIRVLMFFNPVVLVEFRRMVQEEEKICDDVAVARTQRPGPLAEILRKFNYSGESLDIQKMKRISTLSVALEDYSHNVHLGSRIKRLEQGPERPAGAEWLKFLLTLVAIGVINYFVV